jgi:hypothetical protein
MLVWLSGHSGRLHPALLGCHSRHIPECGDRVIGSSGELIGSIESDETDHPMARSPDDPIPVVPFGVSMNDRQLAEYRVLRDTIRQRGTLRMALIPVIFIGWAATAIATAAIITVAISTLVPLLVLVAGFETVFAFHINVERIGRYIQAFHEKKDEKEDQKEEGWEHVAMAFGQRLKSGATDPLFSQLFVFGISLNFLPVALGGEMPEIVVLGVLHLLAVFRIRMARRTSNRQREEELRVFENIRAESK